MFIFRCLTILILVLSLISPMKVQAYNNISFSTWLWNTQDIVQNSDKILSFLSTHNVKVLYLQVNYDLNVGNYKRFISKASTKNISVQALNGGPDWIFPKGQGVQKQFFDWLSKYQNSALPNERFKGVHLDVEPYLNHLYAKTPNIAIEGYQDFLISSIKKCNTLKLPIGIDIPFWFDEVKYSTRYGTGSLLEWVLKNIKDVNVMAYRNSALGDNGIIKLISNEINLAKKYNDKVTVAVETQKSLEGGYLSFYGIGQAKMQEQLNKVYNYYHNYTSFNNFAIHDVKNWMLLN